MQCHFFDLAVLVLDLQIVDGVTGVNVIQRQPIEVYPASINVHELKYVEVVFFLPTGEVGIEVLYFIDKRAIQLSDFAQLYERYAPGIADKEMTNHGAVGCRRPNLFKGSAESFTDPASL